ncbi:MAG: F0F1 ATP synthase subunit delta [Candidatus Omnitrophota bacterium]
MLIVSFILLMVLLFAGLAFFFYKILNRNVISATGHLEQLAAEYAKKEEEIKKKLNDTQRQCQEIIANAQKDAQKQREEIFAKVQEEKESILNEAHQKGEEIVQQADRTRQALIAEIEQKIEERALGRATELIQQTLPEQIRAEVHRRWLEEIISGSFEQLERLNIPEGDTEAKVISAFELTAKQRESLKAKIKEKLGREIEVKEEVNPGVIAGLVVNIGSLVLDGSLRFKIKEAASAQGASG